MASLLIMEPPSLSLVGGAMGKRATTMRGILSVRGSAAQAMMAPVRLGPLRVSCFVLDTRGPHNVTRTELTSQIRMSSLLESTAVSDTEIQTIINAGVHWVDGWYPFPGITIAELSAGGDSPAWNEAFHWILVNYSLAKLMEREEYFDVAAMQMEEAITGVRQMVKFYSGGRT